MQLITSQKAQQLFFLSRAMHECPRRAWSGLSRPVLKYLGSYVVLLILLLSGSITLCHAADEPDYSSLEGLPILRIEVSGNKRTKEYVVTRELQTGVGDSLNPKTMQSDIKRLTKLPAFSKVDIVPVSEGAGVVYTVKVYETAWLLPAVLPGNSEENGWYAGPMISTPNWFGRAISASISTQFGGITKYSFSVYNPWISVAHRQFSLSGGTNYQEREDKIRESQEITSASSMRTVFYPGLNRIASVGLGFQYLRTMSDKSGVTLSPTNSDHLYRLELLFRINSIQDPLDPRDGWVAGVQEMRTGGFLGGDGDTWRTQVDITHYRPLFDRCALALGGVFDHQSGIVGQDIPTYLQYSLGGVSSIRGYSRTELGKVLYGKNQLLVTAEYSYQVTAPRRIQLLGLPFLAFRVGFNVVAFVDGGVAWSEKQDLSWNRSKTGVGVGFHFMVPGIDRIRLDLGFNDTGDLSFHIGTKSKFDAHR
jgi:outer membrane protein insertion porin family